MAAKMSALDSYADPEQADVAGEQEVGDRGTSFAAPRKNIFSGALLSQTWIACASQHARAKF